jgi:hypothetical protein
MSVAPEQTTSPPVEAKSLEQENLAGTEQVHAPSPQSREGVVDDANPAAAQALKRYPN